MRTAIDLLELEFSFSQQSPLTISKFIKEFEQRVQSFEHHIFLDWEQLEELHKVGVLVPIFRFKKNVRPLLKQARQEKRLATSIGLGKDTNFATSHYGLDYGTLKDPQLEGYKSWYIHIHQYKTDYYWSGKSGQEEEIGYYWSSSFLYSPYQLLLVPQIRKLLAKIKRFRTRRKYSSKRFAYRLTLDEDLQKKLNREVAENRDLTVALTALETKYLPQLKGHRFSTIYSVSDSVMEEIMAYQQSFDPVATLEWIGWDANKVKEVAQKLLWLADNLDPLKDWYELVRMCHPDMLNKLRGDALIASDHRRAAEILLRFYEDLQTNDAAPPYEEVPRYVRGPYDTRLKYDLETLDEVLMKFGLSPQPLLVLIIEGETEEYLVPKVMDLLGIPQHSSFIHVFNIRGIERDVELLARYIVPSKLGKPLDTNLQTNAIELSRPLIHFFVLVDAEKDYETNSNREEKRAAWVEKIYAASPEEYQTNNFKNDLDSLLKIETWDNKVFEFAHFSGSEISKAMVDAYRGRRGSIDALLIQYRVANEAELLAKLAIILDRISPRGNIEKSITETWDYPPGKPKIAETLWPKLEGKIRNAIEQNNIESIPIAHAILKAWEIAAHNHRKKIVMRY